MQLTAWLNSENAGYASAVMAALLLLAGGHCVDGEARAQSASAAPPAVKRLCGERSDTKPRVLLGRFSLFGEFEPNLRSLDQLFVGNVEWGLFQQQDILVFRSKGDSIDLQQFKGLPALIDDALNISATTAQSTSSGTTDPSTKALLDALKMNNCDYLFGGRISRAGTLINIEPSLLDVESGIVSRPFAASNGDAQSLIKIAELFTGQLSAYLRERQRPALRARFVEVDCLTSANYLGSFLEQFSALVRKQIVASLGAGKKLPVRPSGGKDSSCESLVPNRTSDVAAVVRGQVVIEEVTSLVVRPSVRLVAPSYEVALAPLRYPIIPSSSVSLIGKMPAEFAAEVNDFLVAATRADGSFPEPAPWMEVSNASDERAALAAYTELARDQSNAQANFVLGKVFQGKQEPELGLRYFRAAYKAERSLPDGTRADLNEALGELSKEPAERKNYFMAARDLHRDAKNDAGVRRATRGIAHLLYFSGQKAEAIAELQNQPDRDQDYESLRLLGLFLSLSEKETEAIQVLSKALRLQPNDEETKSLLAETYEGLGRKAYTAKQLILARENFGLALTYRESGSSFYLAGLSAYDLGNFRDAATLFDRVTKLPSDKSSLRFVEASWLTMLECYLLLGDYAALEARGQDASSFLKLFDDSRLLAAYLRLVGRIIANPQENIAELRKEASFSEIQDVPRDASAKKLDWNNNKVDNYIAQKVSNPDKKKFLAELRQQVWRDPMPLK